MKITITFEPVPGVSQDTLLAYLKPAIIKALKDSVAHEKTLRTLARALITASEKGNILEAEFESIP